MNSRRFGAVLTVAIALGLLGQAGAQDEAGQPAEKDTASQGADICKNPHCPRMVGAWLQDLKACEVKSTRIKELTDQVASLKGKGQEGAELQSRLDTCSAAGAEAEKRAKEAANLAEGLRKELEELKRVTAIAGGDPAKLMEAVSLANAWKAEADRIKDEGEAARKEAAELKAEADAAKKAASEIKAEADAAKKAMSELNAKVAALEKDPVRGVTRLDQTLDKPETEMTDLELKNKRLQEILDDTRKVLEEKEKEKELSEGAIRLMLTDLVDLLGRTFECASFNVEMRHGAGVLKGTVGESRHRDDAWKMVRDSPLARLVRSSEIDVTASGSRVCFDRTREPGWLVGRGRDKADPGATLFLRLTLDASVIPLLPRAGDHSECERLGDVIKSLEPLDPQPSEPAVWVRGSNDAVTQCYASPDGWKLRSHVSDRDGKLQAWILVPESQLGGGVRP
jgi:uncharacterized coiled-coil DUF342 family protein